MVVEMVVVGDGGGSTSFDALTLSPKKNMLWGR